MKAIQPLIRNNTEINYIISGEGKTTLLFVHGSNINQTYWAEQVAFFEPHYKVVILDLPGHGESGQEREQWSIEEFADDIITAIIELELTNIILIGHSLGGDVNLVAATKFPEHIIGFIGIDNFKNAGQPLGEEYQEKANEILENLKTKTADTNEQYARMVLLTGKTPATIIDRVVADYRKAEAEMSVAIMDEVFNSIYKTEQQLLPQLPFKMYLINVDYMPTNEGPLKQYLQHGYEVIQIHGTSHFPMIENASEFNQVLKKVVDKIEKV